MIDNCSAVSSFLDTSFSSSKSRVAKSDKISSEGFFAFSESLSAKYC